LITTFTRSIIRLRWALSLLATLLLTAPFCAPPANAAASDAHFRVVLPLMLMSQPAPTLDATPEAQVVALTNELRRQHGCQPLSISPALTAAAQDHSQDMADHNYFSHIDRSGNPPAWRAQRAGYTGSAGAENLGAGYATAEEVVMGWYNETPPNDGHRLNLLNCALTEIGVGYAANPASDYGVYWTQDFGQM
jgi:uncharacterized protein YkwD